MDDHCETITEDAVMSYTTQNNLMKSSSPEIENFPNEKETVCVCLENNSSTNFILPHDQGKLGIKNLGNTCYMNSALQCLAHTKEMIYYFLTEQFNSDLERNKENNPKKGDEDIVKHSFTNHFARFIRDMWSDLKDTINLTGLRSTLVKICPQFDNNTQQDAHEVLTLMLDALHGQLNRVRNENEMINCDGMTTDQAVPFPLAKHLSQTSWDSHKTLNDSFIIDTFFGQLKSSIYCLNCTSTYFKYDPFSSLELPIPNEYKILIYFIPLKKILKPVKLFVKINDNMQFKHIIDKVRVIIDYNFKSGIFYWVLNNNLQKIADYEEKCGDLMNRTNFLFLIEAQKCEKINSHENKFYSCLNFFLYEQQDFSEKRTGMKTTASFPRVFPLDFVKNEEISDKLLLTRIFSNINDYVRNYIHNTSDMNIADLYHNKLIYYTISAFLKKNEENLNLNLNLNSGSNKMDVEKSNQVVYICKLCQNEKEEPFSCGCINDVIFSKTFDIDSKEKFDLVTYLANLKVPGYFNLDINAYISADILKYRELNRCRDYTQKVITEKDLDLYDLCDYFMAEEKLSNYNCETCKTHVFAYKQMQINQFPQILVINLKRFRYENLLGKSRFTRRNENNGFTNISNFNGEKNETLLNFKIELDLTKYTKDSSSKLYELYAVCYHNGKISAGHYTAVCKHPSSGKWIEYDDKTVKPFSESSLVNRGAYLLFYRKKD